MKRLKALLGLFGVLILMAALVFQAMPSPSAYADQITSRSLTLQAGATSGGSAPGAVVNHLFKFTLPNTAAENPSGNIGSIKFQYCTTAADVGAQTCVEPTGLQTANATLGTQTGATGFTLVADPAGTPPGVEGSPYLTRTAATISPGTTVSYQLLSVTNPSAANETFFVRISTYASTDATGTPIDTGTVTASTATPIVLNGTMPESLVFCTGATVPETNSVPDCTKATSGDINFTSLFSPTATSTATSQMAASTNAGSGYNITVNGNTMKSGATNQINALGTADYSKQGISQFGMNLVKNAGFCGTGCDLGADITQDGGTLYKGEALTGYSTGGDDTTVVGEGAQFKFTSGDSVADSQNSASDAQTYTVSYIVNVPGSQPAGTYTTTLTYICTASY